MGGLVTRRKAIGDALARGLGIAGIALGKIGIAQAQSTNPSLNNAFVRKSPPIIQSIIPTSLIPFPLNTNVAPTWSKQRIMNSRTEVVSPVAIT